MIDAITGRCGKISVFQLEGKDGTAHVRGTKFMERVPRGDDGYAALQWLGLKQRREAVDPRPSFEHYECMYIGHLNTHESVWTHQDEFSPRHDRKDGKARRSYCKACEAEIARRYRQRQAAQAAMTMQRAG